MARGEALSACADLVRRHDPDRYFCDLMAPPACREGLLALHAFELELARIPERVSEAMLGAIRLQWWRESLDGIAARSPRRHEVVLPLAAAIDNGGLEPALLHRMIDAWDESLAREDAPDLAELERHHRETRGTANLAALRLLGGPSLDGAVAERAAGEAALAAGLTGMLLHGAAQARLGKPVMPRDVLRRHGLDLGTMLDGERDTRMRHATEELALRAGCHVDAARKLGRNLPPGGRAALLPVAFAAADLARLRRCGHDLFDPRLQHRGIGRQLRVLARALAGKI